jgi:outer membrane protein
LTNRSVSYILIGHPEMNKQSMRRFIGLVFLASASASVSAGVDTPADTQTLIDIYQLAKQNDAVLASAQAGNIAAQEKQVQGKALLLPSVGLSANASRIHSDAEYPGRVNAATSTIATGAQNYTESWDSYGYRLSVSQPLFRKQNWVSYEQSKNQVAQSDEQLKATVQDLVLRVAQAYFDLLLAQDTVELNIAQQAAISNQLEQAKVSFEVGTATITDVNDAQAKYDQVVAEGIVAKNDVEVKKQAVVRIIGQMPQRIAIMQEKPALKPVDPSSMDEWVKIGEAQNLQLKIQQKALEIATQELEKAQAGHYPTLDLVANYNKANQNGSNIGSVGRSYIDTTDIGLQFQVPIYQGGATSSRVREAVANQQKARDDLETSLRQTDFEVQQAFLAATNGLSLVQAVEQAVVSTRSSLDSTKLGYEVGVRTSVDVLNSQQQYFTARRDLLRARYVFLLSKLKLKSAAGMLAEADLTEIDQLLVKQ